MIITDIEQFISENNIAKIFLDIDGVLFASCQACVDIINEKQGTNFNGSDVLSWDFKEVCPTITSKEVEEMFNSDEFFQRVEWIKGALEFVKNHRNDIIIITHASTENFTLKRIFFDQYGLQDIPIIPIPINLSKSIINMSCNDNTLFIDDSTNNLYSSNAKYLIQFKEYNDDKIRNWQKEWKGNVMYEW